MPIPSGIYMILNNITGDSYIGSSVRMRYRWNAHKWSLRKGNHTNAILQSAWNKYGEDSFKIVFVEEVSDISNLLFREQLWLDKFKPRYNIRKSTYPIVYNKKTKAEVLERLSKIRKGKKRSKEVIEQHRKFMTGYKFPNKPGHPQSEETKKKISETLKGTRHSEESYKRASEKKKGQKHSLSTINKCVIKQRERHPIREIDEVIIPKTNNLGNNKKRLTEEKILEIRKLYKEGIGGPELSRTYGVSSPTIYAIVQRKIWKHV